MIHDPDSEMDWAKDFQTDAHGEATDDDLERVAASLALALARRVGLETIPEDLEARILADAEHAFGSRVTISSQTSVTQTIDTFGNASPLPRTSSPATAPAVRNQSVKWPLIAASGWLIASAAAFALAWPSVVRGPSDSAAGVNALPPSPASAEQRMAAMIQAQRSVSMIATDHPLAGSARGQLVWDGKRQEGFMRIEGLPPVLSQKGVYQLWIFDKRRDERYPVDGGTFAFSEAGSTMVVPIRAALTVDDPSLFAITLEPPGGVVVSDRKRILLTAAW